MLKDYKGAILDDIGNSKQTGRYHFIFKKNGKYFGIGIKEFDTFDYIEKPKIANKRSKV